MKNCEKTHQKPEGYFDTWKFSKIQMLTLRAPVFNVRCWYFYKYKYLRLQRYKTNRTPKVTGKDRIFAISTSFFKVSFALINIIILLIIHSNLNPN